MDAELDGSMVGVTDVEATARYYRDTFNLAVHKVDPENSFALIDAGGLDPQLADERAATRTGVSVRLGAPRPP